MNHRWIQGAAMTLLVAAAAAAQTPPRAGKILADYLQLTPDQIAAWRQINKETAAAVAPLAQSARDLRTQLDVAVKAASPDPAAVGKLTLSLHSVRDQIRAAREAAKSKRIALLTPEQKTKFDALQAAGAFMRQQRLQRAGSGG